MSKFVVGDRLRVRQWDDMVAEFGVDSDNDIPMNSLYFVEEMKVICGKIFTVSEINYLCDIEEYSSEEGIENTNGYEYAISGEMLEYAEEESDVSYSNSEIIDILQ